MPPIYLHNTLGNKKEIFEPLNSGEVKMYNCGPTVYNNVHLGNLRSNIFADTLRRIFEYNDYKVTQVVNITDIGHLRNDGDEGEDKMTSALIREGKPLTLEGLKQLSSFYTKAFLEDLKKINIETPTYLPKASEHIKEDVKLIARLEDKDFTYNISDGIYFDTSKYPEYGKLSPVQIDDSQSRIVPNKEKKNQRDFALWKLAEKNSKIGWESPWGKGFPGWHIECSAMAMKYLGETFDVHTGGIDHIQIHHNNEIAQSEAATSKLFARYWLHNAFINIEGEKIAKSLGNDIYLKDVIEHGISPLAYRLYLLGAHYRTPMNFNWEALLGADKALKRLATSLHQDDDSFGDKGRVNEYYKNRFINLINDDLDTPKTLALMWKVLEDKNLSFEDKRTTVLNFDKVFGLNLKELAKPVYFKIPEEIINLAEERQKARKSKDWKRADKLRGEIEKAGFEIKDTEGKYEINIKST